MSKLSKLFLLCTLLVLAIGQAYAYPGKSASSDAGSAAPAAAGNSGTVVQTMNSGGYTYVLLDKDGNAELVPPCLRRKSRSVKKSPLLPERPCTTLTAEP